MSQTGRSLDGQIGYAVKRVQQRVRNAGEQALRPYGLSMPQYAVLAVLAETPGASSAELARRCFVTRQTMTGLVRGLARIDLVDQSPAAGAGRVLPLSLTDSGRALVVVAGRAIDQVEGRLSAALDRAGRDRLLELLDACAAALDSEHPAPAR